MRVYLTILLWLSLCLSYAEKWDWAITTVCTEQDRMWDIALDGSQNIYVTGDFDGTMQIGSQQQVSRGLKDIFVAKYTLDHELLWSKSFGGESEDVGIGIDVDGSGNVYVSGYFNGTADFGCDTLVSNGSWDAFVLKLDTNGNSQWVSRFGSVQSDVTYGIAVDQAGNSYVTGWYIGNTELPDGSSMPSYGGGDILIAKLDTEGNLLWAHHAGREGEEYGYKIDVDGSGNVYVIGSAAEQSVFDGQLLALDGMFVACYNTDGQIQWLGNGGDVAPINISVNNVGVSMSAGRIVGAGVIDGQVYNSMLGPDGMPSNDCVGIILNANGSVQHTIWQASPKTEKGKASFVSDNAFYLASMFDSTLVINDVTLQSAGNTDIAITKYTSGYNPEWTLSAGGEYADVVTDVVADAEGNVILCGWIVGAATFGGTTISTSNSTDINCFLAKTKAATDCEDNINKVESLIKTYPNPFNREMKIQFINTRSENHISIFDCKGRLLRSINTQAPVITWDGKDSTEKPVANGIYFIRCKNGMHEQVTKVLSIRS